MTVQPILPPETAFTEAELNFISLQPYGLWPENQDSNFGQIRRVLTDPVQDNINRLDIIHENIFIVTAEEYLGLWEQQLGLISNPAGRSLAERRSVALGRLRGGPFTRPWRKQIIESFLVTAIGGDAIALTVSGVAIPIEGIPLYAGVIDLSLAYYITEEIEDFHYTIHIDTAITPDEEALRRELTRVTPAGISFDIVYEATPLRTLEVTWAEMEVPA